MKSFNSWRSYWNFERAVRRECRYIQSKEVEAFLDSVKVTAMSRKVTFNQGKIFWRAQIGHDWNLLHQEGEEIDVPCPYSPNRMKPLRDRASEGRANPRGIPCLYLATTKETAMTEVRPWIGSNVSVAQFKLLKPLNIVDCSREHDKIPIYLEEPSIEEIEQSVWAYISRAFAEPMISSDDRGGYVATQIITELFKNAGYDGVAYKSNFGKNGFNIALFDINAADLVSCGLYCVNGIDMKFSKQDNPYFVTENIKKKSGDL